MKFCIVCNNMYYICIDENDPNKLSHYCRSCGNKDEIVENICLLSSTIKNNEQNYNHIINEYTKFDPTLPRIYNIPCPNTECPTNKKNNDGPSVEREIIYLRYDDNNLKYLYICSTCDTTWKTNDYN